MGDTVFWWRPESRCQGGVRPNAECRMMDFLNQPKLAPNLPGYPFSAINDEDLNSVSYLIKGVISQGDIAFMFGDSGTMKSFVATDMVFHVATGMNWRGHRVDPNGCGVLVILGEGQSGYKKRIKAVIKHYALLDAPIWIVPEPIALDREADILRVWIALAEENMGCKIGLVLMDTFSLMLGSGDESSNSDVSQTLNALRKALSGRAVLLIHHTGHGDKGRERGAYQIRGNADVRILVERDEDGKGNVITVTNLKTKDDRLFEPINLGYEVIDLGRDQDGDTVSSLVIVATDREPTKTNGKLKNKALDFIKQAIVVCGSNQRELVRDAFAGIYPSMNSETVRSAFRRGWDEYMETVTKGGRDGW
jgi:AAA domain